MSIRRFKRMGVKPQRSLHEKIWSTIKEVDRLMARKEYVEARQLLTELNKQSPNQEVILVRLGQTHYYLNEYPSYLTYCIQINKLRPNDAEHRLALAHAYLMNARLILAHRAFREFLDRWPAHEEAGRARETFGRIDSTIKKILDDLELSGDQGYEFAVMFEEAQVLMVSGKHAASIAKFNELLKHRPDYTAACNNISLMQFYDGDVAGALATAQRVIELGPSNFHALSNLTHFLLLSGQPEEARLRVEQLKRVTKNEFDRWLKQAEACAAICDDEGVLDALDKLKKTGHVDPGTLAFFVYHLAAVAKLRLGQENEARDLWRQCLALSPAYHVALENLHDLDAPSHEQNGPWFFDVDHWLSRRTIDDFFKQAEKAARHGKGKPSSVAPQWLQKHPTVEQALSILFDRGDPAGRQTAVILANLLGTPETISQLRDFALGRKGSDRLRMDALLSLVQHGRLDSRPLAFRSRGQQIEILLPTAEIYYEVENDNLPPEATELYLESHEYLNQRNGLRAEPLLRRALELVPDSAQLMNNLSSALALQGRMEESEALAREIVERYPEYFFARVNVANRLLDRKEFTKALELIAPVVAWKRMHASEAAALYNTYIQFYYVQGHHEIARFWLTMLKDISPRDPHIKIWRQALGE